jgi:hypothetical protein
MKALRPRRCYSIRPFGIQSDAGAGLAVSDAEKDRR